MRRDATQSFGQEQLVAILLELVKNTFDHSTGIGVLELQLPSKDMPLVAIYRDTGQPFDLEAYSAPGVSTKAGNGVNFGLGLMVVKQGAISAKFDFSVKRTEGATEFRFSTPFNERIYNEYS